MGRTRNEGQRRQDDIRCIRRPTSAHRPLVPAEDIFQQQKKPDRPAIRRRRINQCATSLHRSFEDTSM
jgi:hypothetical protein